MYKGDEDPYARELLRLCDMSYRDYKRFIMELRKLYLVNSSPEISRAAIIQNAAHEANRRLIESLEDMTKFGWELVPYSRNPSHLKDIESKRQEALKRIKEKTSVPRDLPADGLNADNQTIIITRLHGKRREFRER